MTVLTTIAKAGPYAGDGTTGPFTVPFRFLDAAHLRVIRNTAGVETVLALGTDYTVSGVGATSGTVTLVAPLPVGQTLTVVRNVPATQEADYVPGDAFPAESHEQALDKLTMITQQQQEQLGRAVIFPTTDESVSELPTADQRSLRVLGFDANGDLTTYAPASQVTRAENVSYLPAGAGAVLRTVAAKLEDIVSLADFIPADTITATTDCAPFLQAAINAGGGSVFIPEGKYLMSTPVNLTIRGFYTSEPSQQIFGQGAEIVVATTTPLFTQSVGTDYTAKWIFRDLTFTSAGENTKVFDLDRIYNSVFTCCSFIRIGSVFWSRVDRSGDTANFPEGYIQSAQIHNNHFGACHTIIDAKRCFNLSFSANFSEACSRGVVVDGLGDPACNMIRITDNVIEGGGTPIRLGAVFGGVIQGNYIEHNPESTQGEFELNIGSRAHRGLAIVGNQFQPSAAHVEDTNWFAIRLANTLGGNRGVTLISNTISGPRLVTGAGVGTFAAGNFDTSSSTDRLFSTTQQVNHVVGGNWWGLVDNRAAAYDSATTTWRVVSIVNAVQSTVYAVDGLLQLLSIGGNQLGATAVSFKFILNIDQAGVYNCVLLGSADIVNLTGTGNVGAYHETYWTTPVTPGFIVSGSTITITFNNFSDYSYPDHGRIHSLGVNLAVRSMRGRGGFSPVTLALPT